MKLASYQDGSRDGQLVVVSRDLTTAQHANGIATRLQQVLDDWNFLSPQLEDLSTALNQGRARHAFAFDPARCLAPVPRAFHWAVAGALPGAAADGSAGAADGAAGDRGGSGPSLQQGAGDAFLGPQDLVPLADERMGLAFAPAFAVATGDVAAGTSADRAVDAVRLVLLANAWTLRHVAALEHRRGGGLCQAWPATAFAPVAVTPDELGDAWRGGRVHLPVRVARNGQRAASAGSPDALPWHFGELVAHAAKTRALGAGALVGAVLAGRGDAADEPLRFGDTVRIEARPADGPPVFGAIDQAVATPA